MNSYVQKSYMLVCCVFVKNWWIMKLWFVESEWFHVNCGWWCFETCCWWIGVKIIPVGELVMKVVVVVEYLWTFGELLNFDKMMFESWVLSIIEYVFIYMTCKHYLGRVLGVERSIECLGKRAGYFEVFVFMNQFCFLNNLSFWTVFDFLTKFELLNYFWLLN